MFSFKPSLPLVGLISVDGIVFRFHISRKEPPTASGSPRPHGYAQRWFTDNTDAIDPLLIAAGDGDTSHAILRLDDNMPVQVNYQQFRDIAKGLRTLTGRDFPHGKILDVLANSLGQSRDALMHALKTEDRKPVATSPAIKDPLLDDQKTDTTAFRKRRSVLTPLATPEFERKPPVEPLSNYDFDTALMLAGIDPEMHRKPRSGQFTASEENPRAFYYLIELAMRLEALDRPLIFAVLEMQKHPDHLTDADETKTVLGYLNRVVGRKLERAAEIVGDGTACIWSEGRFAVTLPHPEPGISPEAAVKRFLSLIPDHHPVMGEDRYFRLVCGAVEVSSSQYTPPVVLTNASDCFFEIQRSPPTLDFDALLNGEPQSAHQFRVSMLP